MRQLSEKRRRIAWVVLGMLLAGVVIVVVQTITSTGEKTSAISTRQKTNGAKIDFAAESLKILKDCTIQGGRCFNRQQRSTAAALGSIDRANKKAAALAAACADEPGRQTFREIYRCVLAAQPRR